MDPNQTFPTTPVEEPFVQTSVTPLPSELVRSVPSEPVVPVSPEPMASVPSTPIWEFPSEPEKLLPPPREPRSWKKIVSIFVIVLVLIVGALYLWGAKLAEQDAASLNSEIPQTI